MSEHDLMADGTVSADGERRTHVRMQHAAVLHIAALPHRDQLVIAAQNRIEPDAGVSLQPHPPDNIGAGGNPAA